MVGLNELSITVPWLLTGKLLWYSDTIYLCLLSNAAGLICQHLLIFPSEILSLVGQVTTRTKPLAILSQILAIAPARKEQGSMWEKPELKEATDALT